VRVSHVVLCALVVAGCSDSPAAPRTVGESGSLSFAFTGARGAGTYTATGAVPANHEGTWGTAAWASSERNDTTNSLNIIGSLPHTSQTWDLATVELPRLIPGTDSIDGGNCSSEICAQVLVLFGTRVDDLSTEYFCVVNSGRLTLATISATHASGSFSGSGSCFDTAGIESPFAVTNGAFDVGILASPFRPSASPPDHP
jgi:hypothetical protein